MAKYWEGRTPPLEYFEQPNPYVAPPESHINLLALSRYAQAIGVAIVDLPYDVVQKFAVTATEQSTERMGENMSRIMDEIANDRSCVETNSECQINDTAQLSQYSSDAEWYFKRAKENSDFYNLLFRTYREMGISPTEMTDSERDLICKAVDAVYKLLNEEK